MSSKQADAAAAALIQKAQRGARVREIREALKLGQEDFARQLTELARTFGVRARYDKPKVSRIESGTRKLSVEEAAIITTLDPEQRGCVWLVFGVRYAEKGRFRKLG